MMDISADDLIGKSMYDQIHAEDLQKIKKSHIDCEYKNVTTHIVTESKLN